MGLTESRTVSSGGGSGDVAVSVSVALNCPIVDWVFPDDAVGEMGKLPEEEVEDEEIASRRGRRRKKVPVPSLSSWHLHRDDAEGGGAVPPVEAEGEFSPSRM